MKLKLRLDGRILRSPGWRPRGLSMPMNIGSKKKYKQAGYSYKRVNG